MTMKRTSLALTSAVILLALTGCAPAGSTSDAATPSPTPTATKKAEPAPPKPAPTPTAAGTDRTYEARTAGGGIVSKAIEEPAGFITIYTDVASPYSDAQAVSRQEAIIACEAVRATMSATTVMVLDAGDDAFVIYNGKNFPACAVK